MHLIINGETKEFPDNITVEELLEREEVETPQYVSVQINDSFVLREHFSDTQLKAGDRVDFLYYMGGGSKEDLSAQEVERYSRQLILGEVGLKGQLKLRQGSVLIVGAGGLGSPAAFYLAAAGIGKIGLIDFDKVELHNLQRQILYSAQDVGRYKVDAAAEKLQALNSEVEIVTYPFKLSAENALDILHDYQFIVDATDGFSSKFLINDACFFAGKPFVHAGILRFEGQSITVVPGETTCYRCIFPTPPPPGAVPSCAQAGILGVLGGMLGTIEAAESIKYILGEGDLLLNKLFYFNAKEMQFHLVNTSRNPKCPLCSENASITELNEENIVCQAAGGDESGEYPQDS